MNLKRRRCKQNLSQSHVGPILLNAEYNEVLTADDHHALPVDLYRSAPPHCLSSPICSSPVPLSDRQTPGPAGLLVQFPLCINILLTGGTLFSWDVQVFVQFSFSVFLNRFCCSLSGWSVWSTFWGRKSGQEASEPSSDPFWYWSISFYFFYFLPYIFLNKNLQLFCSLFAIFTVSIHFDMFITATMNRQRILIFQHFLCLVSNFY